MTALADKRILLDCDGVLADFVGPVLDLVHEVTGRRHKREDIAAFDFVAQLGLSRDEAVLVKREISHRDGWWCSLPVYEGARAGVDRLREFGEVFVVTSPWNSCRTWLHDRETWLAKHFDIPASNLLVGSAKHLVAGDMLVDDRSDTLREWARWHGHHGGKAVQWQTPHNRNEPWLGLSTRCWNELAGWAS